MTPDQVDLVIVGNATAGRLLNQACIRGQSFLLDAGLRNAGSSTSTTRAPAGAPRSTWPHWPTLGGAGTVLAVGVEKMWTGHRGETLAGIEDGVPDGRPGLHARQLGEPVGLGADGPQRQVDGRAHGGLGDDPRADRRRPRSRPASTARSIPMPSSRPRSPSTRSSPRPPWWPPLTRLMCSSFTDGAAAVVLVPRGPPGRTADPGQHRAVGQRGHRLPRAAGRDGGGGLGRVRASTRPTWTWSSSTTPPAPRRSAPSRHWASSNPVTRGRRRRRATPPWAVRGSPSTPAVAWWAGAIPSGATGIAQVVELTAQLRDGAGARQVPGARLAVAANTGGMIGSHAAPPTQRSSASTSSRRAER